MKKLFVKDIREKDRVYDSFIVTRKDTGVSKSGKPYLNLRLMDSTGQVEARVWEGAEALAKKFDADDVVKVKGFAVSYQGGLQLNVSDIEPVPESGYSLADFLPSSKRDPAEMMKELEEIISGVQDRYIKALLEAVFKDPDVRGRFMHAPAAKAMHHPYIGGLLEHVLSICGLAGVVSKHYARDTDVNKDLLTAGAILHDIGKIYELEYSRAFGYTDVGRLVGHITLGVELIDEKMKEVAGFPGELAMLLKHMLLSHHGRLEFGSPKRPKILEAVMLYYLDDLDAKVAAFRTLLEGEEEGGWTGYQRMFERPIYRGGRPAPSGEKPRTEEEKEAQRPGGDEDMNLFKNSF
ncbi:MAG: 3'-5' exoribonuclease YhaM family protein [Thermodesulfobacteriota bacterium]